MGWLGIARLLSGAAADVPADVRGNIGYRRHRGKWALASGQEGSGVPSLLPDEVDTRRHDALFVGRDQRIKACEIHRAEGFLQLFLGGLIHNQREKVAEEYVHGGATALVRPHARTDLVKH